MKCPQCGNNGSRVVDSRPTNGGQVIRRRRECEKCQFRFTTFERVEAVPLLIIKKNGSREEFDREKILRGIVRAAEKRPVTMKQMTDLVNQVENKIRSLGESEVSSQVIGEYVMSKLVDLDEIAYIRFASVYRQFKDMHVFFNELQGMLKKDEKKESK